MKATKAFLKSKTRQGATISLCPFYLGENLDNEKTY